MVMDYDVTYRPPKQKRSKETVERILEAAEACIRDGGFDALRVADVAAESGAAVATVYSRFPDRMALLSAVQTRLHARIEPAFNAFLAQEKERGGSLEEEAERVFSHLSRHFLSERELFSACMMQAVFDPSLKARGEEANRARRDAVSSTLLVHRSQIVQREPVRAVEFTYDTCVAVVKSRLIWPSVGGSLDEEVFIHDLTNMLTIYLAGRRKEEVKPIAAEAVLGDSLVPDS